MLQDCLRESFLKKGIEASSCMQLYERFSYYYYKYQNGDAHSPVEKFSNCIWYIKAFLKRYSPENCVRVVQSFHGLTFNPATVEQEYMKLMHLATMLQEHYECFDYAAHWAMKSLDLISYFHPGINASAKEKIVSCSVYYRHLQDIFKKHEAYFDEDIHKDVIFDWETAIFINRAANQNRLLEILP